MERMADGGRISPSVYFYKFFSFFVLFFRFDGFRFLRRFFLAKDLTSRAFLDIM